MSDSEHPVNLKDYTRRCLLVLKIGGGFGEGIGTEVVDDGRHRDGCARSRGFCSGRYCLTSLRCASEDTADLRRFALDDDLGVLRNLVLVSKLCDAAGVGQRELSWPILKVLLLADQPLELRSRHEMAIEEYLDRAYRQRGIKTRMTQPIAY